MFLMIELQILGQGRVKELCYLEIKFGRCEFAFVFLLFTSQSRLSRSCVWFTHLVTTE
jgi:hypothetical protein